MIRKNPTRRRARRSAWTAKPFAPSTNARPAPETKPRVVCSQINEQLCPRWIGRPTGPMRGQWSSRPRGATPATSTRRRAAAQRRGSSHGSIRTSQDFKGSRIDGRERCPSHRRRAVRGMRRGSLRLRAVYGIAEDGKASPTDRKSRWKATPFRSAVTVAEDGNLPATLARSRRPGKGTTSPTGATGSIAGRRSGWGRQEGRRVQRDEVYRGSRRVVLVRKRRRNDVQ